MGGARGRIVLVTGGSGFMGANLTRRLVQEGARVHLLVRPGSNLARLTGIVDSVSLHFAELLDFASVRTTLGKVRPSWVFHLAAKGGHPSTPEERLEALRCSFLGTANLLEAVREVGVSRFIHTGSSLEYGRLPRPAREQDALRPHTARGIAKAAASTLVLFYARAYAVPAVILRPFSVYGPWEPPGRLIPTLLRAAFSGEEVPLTAPGFRHDFVFVEDVVEACLRLAAARIRPGDSFNVGTGKQWTNEDVAALVEALTGRTLRLQIGARPPSPPDTSCWVASVEKLQRRLGWRPQWDLPAGLRATLDWMLAHEPAR